MSSQKTISERIQYAMDKQDMTQADLARKTQLSTAVISQIVSGKTKNPSFNNMLKIAIALNVPLDYLGGSISYYIVKYNETDI